MQIVISPTGIVRTVYGEEIQLESLGRTTITRASTVEPTVDGTWLADLALVGGPELGPFIRRSDALVAELDWLQRFWLPG